MDDAQPGLFELPDAEPQPSRPRPRRGKKKESWTRTVTAEVVIVDQATVEEAAARADENSVIVDWNTGPLGSALSAPETGAKPDLEPEPAPAPEPEPEPTIWDRLAWMIWPNHGLDHLVEADAFRVIAIESAVEGESDDRGTAILAVTVKLIDVPALRRLATQAHPDDAALIADDFAAAWHRADDPFAPLHAIPGIEWRPGAVDIAPGSLLR